MNQHLLTFKEMIPLLLQVSLHISCVQLYGSAVLNSLLVFSAPEQRVIAQGAISHWNKTYGALRNHPHSHIELSDRTL